MTPVLWMLVGLLVTHVLYALLFVGWWYWMLHGDLSKEELDQQFREVQQTIRNRQRRRTDVRDVADSDPHRW